MNRMLKASLLCLAIVILATGIAYCEDKAAKIQDLQAQIQELNDQKAKFAAAVNDTLNGYNMAIDSRIKALEGKISKLKTVELDTTKIPPPPKKKGNEK